MMRVVTVDSIMRTDVVTLSMNDTFGGGLDTIADRRIRSLPVVDDKGIYRGTFDLLNIWEILLPRAALLASQSVPDLSFLSGSRENLVQKLNEAAPRPISEFLDNDKTFILYPDTPVEEAILLLYRRSAPLPVVDRKSRKLLGVVTAWEILQLLRR
jgi:CBS domain-containing protein